MGKVKLVDLSQPFGDKVPLWPYFPDVKIERFHYHAKSGVLSQQITTFMHCTTHADSPAHVIEGAEYTDEIPLDKYYGTGVVVDIPKGKWGVITPAYSPGLYKEAGEWFVEKGVKAVGVDQQALDHPFGTAIGPHGPGGPLLPDVCEEYKKETGREVKEDFPYWEPCHRALLSNGIMGWENVGGDLDQVVGMRVTIAGWPIRWVKGDGSIVRLVAIVDSGDQ
jgi:kynurenine formamidase